MTEGGLTARWGINPPPGHPLVVAPRGRVAGAACGCGDWQAYLGSPNAARDARLSYEEHLDRTAPGWRV